MTPLRRFEILLGGGIGDPPTMRLGIAILSVLVFASAAGQEQPPAMALVGGMVIDGSGGEPYPDGAIVIRGERIEAVGPAARVAIPKGANVIDTNGMTMMPGLIDAHMHLGYLGFVPRDRSAADVAKIAMAPVARQLLSAGVTTIRDPYIPLEGIEFKRRIERGEVVGPRVYVSGPALSGNAPADRATAFGWGVGDEADVRVKVRRLADAGADFVKVLAPDRMQPGTLKALVDEATARRLPVTSHALTFEELRAALAAGIERFEHVDGGTAPAYPADLLETLARANVRLYLAPTMIGFLAPFEVERFAERTDHPALRSGLADEVARQLSERARQPPQSAWTIQQRRSLGALGPKFTQIRNTGITLVVGSDGGTEDNFPAEATWREMWAWEKLGVPPLEIISAATYWPARMLGRTDLGILQAGALADIIVVDGNPSESVRDLRRVSIVIKGGKKYE